MKVVRERHEVVVPDGGDGLVRELLNGQPEVVLDRADAGSRGEEAVKDLQRDFNERLGSYS